MIGRTAVLFALLVPAGGIPALAQTPAAQPPGSVGAPGVNQEVVAVLAGNQRPLLRLAFPAFTPYTTDTATGFVEAAGEIEATLRADLEEAGVFQIQGIEALSAMNFTGDLPRDFEQVRSLGNEVLLAGEVKREGDRIVLESRVYDLASGQTILGKRYAGDPAWARRLAHTYADEIVRHFTGQPGLALTSLVFTSDRTGNKEIFVMDADGENQRAISNHKSISLAPTWKSSGDLVAYVSFVDGPPGLYLAELATGRKRPLVTEGNFNSSPSISPDGRQVAFARSLRGNVEIFLADLDGGNLRQLTQSAAIDTNPSWSPDGRSISFTSSRGGSPQIYVMDADGTNLRRVTFTGDYNDGAVWHPRQPLLAYATRIGNRFDLASVDLVTLESRVLTSGAGSKEEPSFSPDGRKLAFAWDRDGRKDIFVLDLATSLTRQLTRTGRLNADPSWSPYPK